MNKLEMNQMENVNGGTALECAGGILAMAGIAGVAFCAPEVFAATLLTGDGAMALAGVTAGAYGLISENC